MLGAAGLVERSRIVMGKPCGTDLAQPGDVVRGQYSGYRSEEGVDPDSDTETFIALKCHIDNWRWAGVPFYLRTGKRLAEGQRIISIAFREPPKSMFPPGSGVGSQGPDHLTFDLADASKMSLSFYGKRPGPGMRLDKPSLQFAMTDTGLAGEVLEAYERLILDAMRGDRTLFTTAEGIERLWEVSTPLLEAPPPVRLVRGGRSRCTSSSRRTPGGCPSSGRGASRTCRAVEERLPHPQRHSPAQRRRPAVVDLGQRARIVAVRAGAQTQTCARNEPPSESRRQPQRPQRRPHRRQSVEAVLAHIDRRRQRQSR
ncbi:hypothetical protein [uncultured Sphaerotilus sp.]|uniref:hypothetical protein n=1 Tax=uncultured Sphaerotilus sp. TaxID=474984 RepID=UPI0030CA269B